MTNRAQTPHGELLDRARVALGLSQRQAARRAGISEGRWRQIVTGVQRQGGVSIPVNPKASTLAAMARSVEADVHEVLDAAGLPPIDTEDAPPSPNETEAGEDLRAAHEAMLERIAKLEDEMRALRSETG